MSPPPKPRALKRALRAALPIVVLAFVTAAAIYAYLRRTEFETLEVYGQLPQFELIDQKGRKVSHGDLRGRVIIASFIFTRCPTICPTFSMKMKRVAKRLDNEDKITFVSFSVDPDYDSPEVLAEFAARFDADPENWRFLTGDPETIKKTVEDGLAVAMERRGTTASGAPDIVHGTHFVLIDADLNVRGYYNSDTGKRIDELVHDARGLAQQILNALVKRIEDQLDGTQIHSVMPLAGDACQDSFTVELQAQGRDQICVLRSDAVGHLPGSLSRRVDYRIIQAAREGDVLIEGADRLQSKRSTEDDRT